MSRKVKVDMNGVESFTRCPEGEWLAKLKKADMGEIQGSGDDCIKAQFEVIKGSAKGNTVFETFSLTEKALWKLKSFLEAAGMKSDGKFTLDLDKMEGKICIIDVIHDEYNGQKRAKIASYIKPGDESDDDIDDDDEIIDEDDDEEEESPKKSTKKTPAKATKKKVTEPDDDDEEDDWEDDDEEEEEPPTKPKKSKKAPAKSTKKAPAKKSAKKSKAEDDEDDDWEEDDD